MSKLLNPRSLASGAIRFTISSLSPLGFGGSAFGSGGCGGLGQLATGGSVVQEV